MISILYPEGDYTSADIAIKLQALAQGQSGQIFIVPKHFGRNDENVYKNLSNSKTALLLSHDKPKLDETTSKELLHLLNNHAKIYSIAPIQSKDSLNLPAEVSSHFYDQSKPGDFLKTVQNIVADLQNQKTPQNSDFGVLLVIMALIILIVAAFDNGKK